MLKKSANNCVFVFSLCCNFFLIKFIVCGFAVLGVAAIDEQQRQEKQQIKFELTEALNNGNTNLTGESVIVQPLWTQSAKKSIQTESVNAQVNEQNRDEVAALTDEDHYATAGETKMQDINMIEASLATKGIPNSALLIATDKRTEAAMLKDEFVSPDSDDNDQDDVNLKAPNVVTSNFGNDLEIDVRKLQSLEVSKRRTREVLILKYIEEDISFAFGAGVNEWKHIVHAGEEYLIGRRVTDLLMIHKGAAKYEEAMVVDIGHVITCIETYTYWNWKQQLQEGIVLIATGNRVLWYRINHETKQLGLDWDLMLDNIITDLTHFTLDSKEFLIVSTNQSFLAGHYALNIYQFSLETNEFWIVQRLQLQYPCEEVTVLDSGRDIILAMPQNNTAALYTFNPHEADSSNIRFELKRSVAAEGILTIAGFKIGGRSYLALTGYKPQILMYLQGDFISKTLLANNFGFVELFFPISVRTYRDDLLLLVQHRVDFSTHTLTLVETLIWDGETFENSIPVPCHLGKHVAYGVGCMLDVQRDKGIKGAALLRNGDDISIVVPRYKAESGLFRFHTELLAKNSELLDLQEIFDFLKSWVEEQDDLIAQAERFLQIPNEELMKFQSSLTFFDTLTTPEFVCNGEVGEVYINDYKWTLEDSNVDLESVIQDIEDLDRSFNSVRQRRTLEDVLHDKLEFDEVFVDELELENLNGQKFFIQNGQLNFDGHISFSDLEVLEKAMDVGKRQVNDEDSILDGDMQFDKINYVEWSTIRDNLVFKNQKQHFGELVVEEEIFVENVLTINTLNALNFPDDFMLSTGPASSMVKAEKHFANSLSASSIDTDGLINDKNSSDVITLADEQEWQGMLTFRHLEVAKVLELHGRVQGREKNITFSQNPTLQETKTINATCHFNELFVNGPIILRGKMDDQSLGHILKDILHKSSDPNREILVPSLKSFETIIFGTDLYLQNNTINRIPVSSFATANTEQTLSLTSLEGNFYFYNLTLNGSYDGVNIENLLDEVILLDEAIDLSTTELIFPGEISASSISILDTINNQKIQNNLQTLQEDLNLKSAVFENLQTQQADFSHDILGGGKLNNIELHSLVNEKSWHEPPARGNIFLNELILEQGLQTDELHGIRAEFLLDFLDQIDELPEMVLNGQIQVDHIIVTGDVQVHKLNGLLFDEDIQLTTIKLNRPNFLSTSISFKNRLNIKGYLNVVADFRGEYLPDVIEDIVVRSNNSCIDIKAPKSFLRPVEVFQNTQVKALNGILIENMAWTTKEINFMGSVRLKGNLIVRDINIGGSVNNFNWQDLQSLLYFDQNLKKFVLKNTIEFKTTPLLEDLTVKGDLNDVPNLSGLFENLIYKNQSCLLKGKNTFTGRVSIDNGACIDHLNGHHIKQLFNNLVFIHGTDPVVIDSPVTFKDSIRANEIQVKNSLTVEYLTGCSIREWINDSLRLDQDLYVPHVIQFSAGSVDGNSFSVRYINDIDLTRIITLNTPQTFNETVRFSDVILNGFILSNGSVNNMDLEKEFNNTLMTYGHQHISTPLTIQSIVVLDDLVVRGLVNNNKDLRDVATLHEDLVFESPLYFKWIYSPHVITKDLVTGIVFDKWFEKAIRNHQPNTQYITGNWSAKYLKIKTGSEELQYMTSDIQPWPYYSYTRLSRSDNQQVNGNLEICKLIKQIWRDLSKKSVHIKYIEEFHMDFDKQIKNNNETFDKLFYLKSNQEHFMLINLKCLAYIYKWLPMENKFSFENSFESGSVDEIEVVPVLNKTAKLEFITTSTATETSKCSLKAVNKWKIVNDSIVLDDGLPQNSYLLYKFQGSNTSLWSLQNDTLKELHLDYEIKRKWQLPVERNKIPYRFVPSRDEQEILLTNGEHLVVLSNNLAKKFKKSPSNSRPQFFQNSFFENLKDIHDSESVLKPNNSLTHSFVFSDFKDVITRILLALSQRINQQINITQLSIPETDLIDVHLVPDFLNLVKELQNQNIYSPEVFNTSFADIVLPESPAQILAARVVQISWPVVVEIEKIHSYLRTNTSHDHPLCARITRSVGFLMRDLLRLINEHNSLETDVDHTLKLTSVIERIRAFDSELKELFKALKNHQATQIEEHIESASTNRELRILSPNQDNIRFMENSHLPGYKQGEILSLLVGTTTNFRHLWAVTHTKTPSRVNHYPGIILYLEDLNSQIYQVIAATQPRSLQQFRIKQETFLIYIDNCCQVEILRYHGLKGFQQFAEIHSEENIKQILTIPLPSYHQGLPSLKPLIILLFERNIKFYEFVIEGLNFAAAPSPLNCL